MENDEEYIKHIAKIKGFIEKEYQLGSIDNLFSAINALVALELYISWMGCLSIEWFDQATSDEESKRAEETSEFCHYAEDYFRRLREAMLGFCKDAWESSHVDLEYNHRMYSRKEFKEMLLKPCISEWNKDPLGLKELE